MHDELLGIIRSVRRRWRTKLAIRGALTVVAIGLLVFLASASALEAARFTAEAILAARIVLALAIAALVAVFFVRPLMRRVTDEQVAMYLEEHEPSLQESIISALEASRAADGSGTAPSRALVQKLVESAVRRSQEIEHGRRVERGRFAATPASLAAVAVAAVALFAFGPAVSAPRDVGDVPAVARRRSRRPVSHRRQARQRDAVAWRRPGDQRRS